MNKVEFLKRMGECFDIIEQDKDIDLSELIVNFIPELKKDIQASTNSTYRQYGICLDSEDNKEITKDDFTYDDF